MGGLTDGAQRGLAGFIFLSCQQSNHKHYKANRTYHSKNLEHVVSNEFGLESALKVSVFMSVFNVHVNRMPADGTVTDIAYRPGKFFSANLNKASQDNERNAVFLDIGGGRRTVVVQIAGLIARRIVCNIHKGDHLKGGQRFGIICFGSRVDCYLPPDVKPAVSVGDKVLAGTSTLGHLP